MHMARQKFGIGPLRAMLMRQDQLTRRACINKGRARANEGRGIR